MVPTCQCPAATPTMLSSLLSIGDAFISSRGPAARTLRRTRVCAFVRPLSLDSCCCFSEGRVFFVRVPAAPPPRPNADRSPRISSNLIWALWL
eukprot:m.124427 g.124427  ORF g.124427 m.124427 type:complete len:93 (+) comp52179_c0_seq1:595-873(+)